MRRKVDSTSQHSTDTEQHSMTHYIKLHRVTSQDNTTQCKATQRNSRYAKQHNTLTYNITMLHHVTLHHITSLYSSLPSGLTIIQSCYQLWYPARFSRLHTYRSCSNWLFLSHFIMKGHALTELVTTIVIAKMVIQDVNVIQTLTSASLLLALTVK